MAHLRSLSARFRRRAVALLLTARGVAKSSLGCVHTGTRAQCTRCSAAVGGERLLHRCSMLTSHKPRQIQTSTDTKPLKKLEPRNKAYHQIRRVQISREAPGFDFLGRKKTLSLICLMFVKVSKFSETSTNHSSHLPQPPSNLRLSPK